MRRSCIRRWTVLGFLLNAGLVSCGRPGGPGPGSAQPAPFRPISPRAADLWDRQTTENADVLRSIVADFNAEYDGLPVKIVQSGDYSDIYRKTTAAVKAGTLPAMAVAYGNMTVEYARAGAVRALDEFIADPELGLSAAELDDFYPGVLEQNRYPEFGGAMLSFPYVKTVLVMYFNLDVLSAAGIGDPPATWDEFIEQCRAVKRKANKHAVSFHVDASTINGFIFSFGGEILDGNKPNYQTEAARSVFAVIDTLFREDLAFMNPPRTFGDQTSFGNDEIAFAFRPSSSLPYFGLVKGGRDGWGVARIPQADVARPATVLYGGNVSVFRTSPDHERAAWAFLKYFAAPEVNARWSVETGYLPCRRSTLNDPRLKAHWVEWRYNRVAFDCLDFARGEPNLHGWQTVRSMVENAAVEVINGLKSPGEAVTALQAQIDAEYARR